MLRWPCDASLGAQAETHSGTVLVIVSWDGYWLQWWNESAWGCWSQGECVSGSEENLDIFCLFIHPLSRSMTSGTK